MFEFLGFASVVLSLFSAGSLWVAWLTKTKAGQWTHISEAPPTGAGGTTPAYPRIAVRSEPLRGRTTVSIAGTVIPIPTRIGGLWFRRCLCRRRNADCRGNGGRADAERVQERTTGDVPA
jgi:hypothetical protein